MPQACATAAGNFAGCAVASTTIGVAVSGRLRATSMAVAVCGSAR
jgi:hypothetical protein